MTQKRTLRAVAAALATGALFATGAWAQSSPLNPNDAEHAPTRPGSLSSDSAAGVNDPSRYDSSNTHLRPECYDRATATWRTTGDCAGIATPLPGSGATQGSSLSGSDTPTGASGTSGMSGSSSLGTSGSTSGLSGSSNSVGSGLSGSSSTTSPGVIGGSDSGTSSSGSGLSGSPGSTSTGTTGASGGASSGGSASSGTGSGGSGSGR